MLCKHLPVENFPVVTLIFFCLMAATNERAGLLPPLEAILKSFLNPLLMFQIHSLILSKNNLHFNVLIPAWRIVFRNKYTADFKSGTQLKSIPRKKKEKYLMFFQHSENH